MIRARFVFLALLACACALHMFDVRTADAQPSAQLGSVLTTLRGLGPQSFSYVVTWARSGAPQVNMPIADYEQAEAQILNLPSADRQAVLLWLQGSGRAALYARGATDDQIGPLRPGADQGAPSASPTPASNWRDLKLASMTLGGGTAGSNIMLLNGFAAAKRDGTSAVACVSFRNVAALTATRVVVNFTLLDGQGTAVGKIALDRHGTFSPNVDIHSFPTLAAWLDPSGQGYVNKGYNDNCVQLSNGVAAVPILSARYATFRVGRVEYADGSVWPTPGPSGTP